MVRASLAPLLAAALLFSACTRLPPRKLEVLHGPATGDLASFVRGEAARARSEGRVVLVYVGATWCEPCQRFHRAAEAGLLDRTLPNLRLLDFDLDRDRERLDQAGYTSQLIPLFAVPGPDGRSSHRQIEGSIKGEGAVGEIAPRLQALIAGG